MTAQNIKSARVSVRGINRRGDVVTYTFDARMAGDTRVLVRNGRSYYLSRGRVSAPKRYGTPGVVVLLRDAQEMT